MDALELTTLINTAANLMAENMSPQQLSAAAALFTQLGDTLATIAAVSNNDGKSTPPVSQNEDQTV